MTASLNDTMMTAMGNLGYTSSTFNGRLFEWAEGMGGTGATLSEVVQSALDIKGTHASRTLDDAWNQVLSGFYGATLNGFDPQTLNNRIKLFFERGGQLVAPLSPITQYDASTCVDMTFDIAGTIPVDIIMRDIGTWGDLVCTADDTTRPHWGASGITSPESAGGVYKDINSITGVYMDGTVNVLRDLSYTALNSDEVSIYFVADLDGMPYSSVIWGVCGDLQGMWQNANGWQFLTPSANALRFFHSAGADTLTRNVTGIAVGPHLYEVHIDSSGNGEMFVDGVSQDTDTSTVLVKNPDILSFGAGNSGGRVNVPTGYSRMLIGELLMYDTASSAGNKTTIRNYLNTKWGL